MSNIDELSGRQIQEMFKEIERKYDVEFLKALVKEEFNELSLKLYERMVSIIHDECNRYINACCSADEKIAESVLWAKNKAYQLENKIEELEEKISKTGEGLTSFVVKKVIDGLTEYIEHECPNERE